MATIEESDWNWGPPPAQLFVAHSTRTQETALTTSQKAPDIALKDQFGREVDLASFRGRCNVMLLFYPLDWTPT